jgi:SulP family sulfate permease
MLKPKILSTLKDYNKTTFFADLNSGIIIGIVALPLAIAFAIASGVSPEKGLITAIIAGFIISALGGSRVQIGGPTGAFIVIVYDILLKYGYDGLLISTVMAGIILMIMGFAKFGSIIKFIPFPIVVGFTSGIAVIIFTAQINDLFGFGILKPPGEFIPKIIQYATEISSINQMSIIISVATLAIIILWNMLKFKVPGSLIAILLTTALVYFLNLPVETIGSRFGNIPSTIPVPSFPAIDFSKIKDLILPATTIAILAAIESLLSAVVADGMIGGKHRSNMELIAQGVANIVTPFFGGIPATGAIARTMTNIKSGGKTPVAGIIHSFVLLLIMLVFAPLAKLIPLATLAAVLVTVAYNMFEWKEFKRLRRSPRGDAMVLITTFLLTIIFDLTVAIEIGMLMAAFLFMRKMALVTNVGVITRELTDAEDNPDEFSIDNKLIPIGVEVYEINGPFFFGAATKFKETVDRLGKSPKIQIIRMRNVPAIDYTGIHFLEEFYEDSMKKGIKVIFSGMHAQPYRVLEQTGFLKKINEKDICGNIDIALARAEEVLKELS